MYSQPADIQDRIEPRHLIELADDDNDGAADEALLLAAIADADAIIDTHLAARYALPFAQPPALLRKLSADLAIDALFARRREAHSPLHRQSAQNAVEILHAIARGEILLAGVAPQPQAQSTTLATLPAFRRQPFTDY